jgi:redox-sensitive bicupin YhaK (pirin superfamily)
VLTAGDVQVMSAGTGVRHSEMNPSLDEPVHFLQIWIHPDRFGLEPGYQEATLLKDEERDGLQRIASGQPSNGEMMIHQDVDLYTAVLGPGASASLTLRPGRHAWTQVIRGDVSLNGLDLQPGDGAAVSDETGLEMTTRNEAEVLVFDLG